jgi:1-acyl-sn-glycerol-3-phosphate acyltransferase
MPITIRISKPLDFARHYDRDHDPLILRQITDEIMFELRELSGQEYVNHYAKRKDTESGTEADPGKVATLPSAADRPEARPTAAVS